VVRRAHPPRPVNPGGGAENARAVIVQPDGKLVLGGSSRPAGSLIPVLFAAGMVLFDSLDGILMSRAYSWAFLKPIRKVYYNFTVTILSVTVALSIGLLLLVQLASDWVPALAWAGSLDLEYVGFGLVALFVLVWFASVAWYHLAHVEEKFEKGLA